MSVFGFSRASVLFATAVVAATGLIVVKSANQPAKSAASQRQLPALDGEYRIGAVEVEFPNNPKDYPTTLTNDACLHSAVKRVRERLYVTVRGLSAAQSALARAYLAELYTQLWDVACMHNKMLLDVRVIPPIRKGCRGKEDILVLPDLEVIMSSEVENINLINSIRAKKDLPALKFIHLENERICWQSPHIIFCEDEKADVTPFQEVACGGTFDNLHNGHKKLLSLAASLTAPGGTLTVGVTSDEMLKKKKLAEYIGDIHQRIQGVEEYLQNVCPGIKTRVCRIDNPFGPPIDEDHFEAILVSSETLAGGNKINQIRMEKGMPPLALIVTRRTEATTLSSTAIREYIHSLELDNEKI